MLDNIKTVQDLINLNNSNDTQDRTVSDKIIDQILDEDPADGLYIVVAILNALEDFHSNAVQAYIDENKPDEAAQWAADTMMIKTAKDMVKDIKL